jgi:hypothetical protein
MKISCLLTNLWSISIGSNQCKCKPKDITSSCGSAGLACEVRELLGCTVPNIPRPPRPEPCHFLSIDLPQSKVCLRAKNPFHCPSARCKPGYLFLDTFLLEVVWVVEILIDGYPFNLIHNSFEQRQPRGFELYQAQQGNAC